MAGTPINFGRLVRAVRSQRSGLPQRSATQSVAQSPTQSLASPPCWRSLDRGGRERTWRLRASLASIAAAESSLARWSRERRTAGVKPAARQASACERTPGRKRWPSESVPSRPDPTEISKIRRASTLVNEVDPQSTQAKIVNQGIGGAPNRVAQNARFPVLGGDAISGAASDAVCGSAGTGNTEPRGLIGDWTTGAPPHFGFWIADFGLEI
jgi:hypothetical protein